MVELNLDRLRYLAENTSAPLWWPTSQVLGISKLNEPDNMLRLYELAKAIPELLRRLEEAQSTQVSLLNAIDYADSVTQSASNCGSLDVRKNCAICAENFVMLRNRIECVQKKLDNK
jgi:hypothetical protein